MRHSVNKGAISLPLALVITLIIFLAIVEINLLFAKEVKEKYDDTEFLNCKLAIDISQGAKIEKSFLGLTGSLQPLKVECEPIILNNSLFKNKDEGEISIIILDRMRTAWWASGRGRYKNLWNDIGAKDSVCKAMYYFRLEDVLGNNKGIRRDVFLVHLENDKLPVIGASLADYMQSSPGISNKYYIATDDEGIVDDKVYGIFVASATDGFNALILAEVVQNSPAETLAKINSYVASATNNKRKKACDEIVGFGNKLQRFWIV